MALLLETLYLLYVLLYDMYSVSLNHLPMCFMHVYASVNLAIIGSDNGLSPVQRQAIIWTNTVLHSLEPWGQTSVKSKSK